MCTKPWHPKPIVVLLKDDSDAGVKYAAGVNEIIQRLKAEGRGIAAFFAESLIGTGGQIVLPEGYLQAVYAHVRSAGGITVADEVQVGFSHPMAAVVTTPEIAPLLMVAFPISIPLVATRSVVPRVLRYWMYLSQKIFRPTLSPWRIKLSPV